MKNIVGKLAYNIYNIIANNIDDIVFNEGVNMWLVGNNMIFIEDNKTGKLFKIKIEEVIEND